MHASTVSGVRSITPNMAFNRTPAYMPSFYRAPLGGRRLT